MNEETFSELIYYYISKNNNITVKNIKNMNQNIDVADCYIYVLNKICYYKYERREFNKNILFMEVRNKLKDYFRIIQKEKYLELEFNKYHRCINDNFSQLSSYEKSILLYKINNKFKRFLDLKFLAGENSRYKDKYINSIKKKLKTNDILKFVEDKFEDYKDFSYNVGGNYNNLLYGETNNDNLD